MSCPLKPCDLQLGVVYLTPMGRPVKLMRAPTSGPGSSGVSFSFEYLDGPMTENRTKEQLVLARPNVRLLKRAGQW